eukprot:2678788-Prymnesium_polylepis.1
MPISEVTTTSRVVWPVWMAFTICVIFVSTFKSKAVPGVDRVMRDIKLESSVRWNMRNHLGLTMPVRESEPLPTVTEATLVSITPEVMHAPVEAKSQLAKLPLQTGHGAP